MSYKPILDDAVQMASLNGQRFVVLRAPVLVSSQWIARQTLLRRELTGAVFYPAAAHLTLQGFVAGTSLDALRTLASDWAAHTSVLRLDAELVDTFPPPAQIASVRIRKTPELTAALGALRDRAVAAGLTLSSSVPLDQWVPRMSLVYAGRLDVAAWEAVQAASQAQPWPAVGGEVRAAEVLAFDDGREHTGGAFAFGMSM